jgi:hypothetical protein
MRALVCALAESPMFHAKARRREESEIDMNFSASPTPFAPSRLRAFAPSRDIIAAAEATMSLN